ncbi:glycosyltransferase family 39 protein [Candidatus Poribacteria bacterium]|nr:glycosyltransferase family 39 protein [Candidatus Poribacteria bacterium]
MSSKKKYFYYFASFISICTIFRLCLAAYLGLGDDEAYYWEWSRHLAAGYFDHPPLVAYVISIFTSILGKTELAVRLGSIILFTLTTYFVYKTSMEMFEDEEGAFYSVLLLNITPVFAAGAFMVFPDAPLGFCWVTALYVTYKIITTGKPWLWYLSGILAGVGLLSKYTAVLIPASVLMFIISSKDHRFWFKKKEPYLACILALIIFSPVILWNINNDWASFGFQLKHGLSPKSEGFSFKNSGFLISSQLLYISPFLFIFSFYVIYLTWKKGIKENNYNYLLLSCFAIPTMALFDIAGIFKRTMPHWTAPGFISIFIALPILAKEKIKEGKSMKINSILTICTAVIITGLITIQTLYPILPIKPKYDVTHDLYGWREAANKAIEIKKEMSKNNFDFFWLSYYHSNACQLAFYLPDQEIVYNFNNKRMSQYNFWFDSTDATKLIGKNAIYVNTNHYDDKPEDYFIFDSMKLEEPINVTRAGKFARSFNIYRIYNFKGVK